MEKREMFETLLRATWETNKVLEVTDDKILCELLYDVLGTLECARQRIDNGGEE